MNIVTWNNFVKRRNSTKQPTATGTTHTATLKEATSIEKPTFVFASNDFSINYVQAFGHYYFVDDIKSVRNGIIEVSCSMDVGATFKTEIGSYNAYIERSYTLVNSMIPDPFVSMLNREIVQSNIYSSLSIFVSGGVYVISVLNDIGSGAGFTTYYATDISNLMGLSNYVNTDWGSGVADFLSWVQATFLHTADCVIDCIWVPIALSQISGSSFASFETMKIGVDQVTGVNGYRFTGPAVVSQTISVAIPHMYSDFRKGAPYTVGRLFIPGYGNVDFNPLDFASDTIDVKFDVDITTGDVVCYLKDASGKVISNVTYNVAVNCPVGKVGANASGTIGGILSTVGGVASAVASSGANAVASGVGAAASAVNTIATAVAPTASIHGGKGGRALMESGLDLICSTIAKYTTDPSDLRSTHGRPSMGQAVISTCSGYVKCSNAEVPIAGMESDKQAVNDLLNSGFYYE